MVSATLEQLQARLANCNIEQLKDLLKLTKTHAVYRSDDKMELCDYIVRTYFDPNGFSQEQKIEIHRYLGLTTEAEQSLRDQRSQAESAAHANYLARKANCIAWIALVVSGVCALLQASSFVWPK